jgi:hypothetical protein
VNWAGIFAGMVFVVREIIFSSAASEERQE